VGEGVLGHIDRHRIGQPHPAVALVSAHRREVAQTPHRLRVRDDVRELVLHVPSPGDAVHLGDLHRRAHDRIEERQLVGGCCVTVVIHEGESQLTRALSLPQEEHVVLGHDDVVENGQAFKQLVPARDGKLERATLMCEISKQIAE
jgi:hypothetical protein